MSSDDRKKLLFVAQEISLAKILSSNDKRTRERGVKKLGKWLVARTQSFEFTEEDLMRIWKGLFYCMWMADKPLVQEEMAENISKLVCIIDDMKFVVNFFGCFFHTMSREWIGIDSFRLDKFLMMIRRVVRQLLVFCRSSKWSSQVIEAVENMLNATVLSSWPARSLTMHFCEVFLVELSKVSKGRIPPETVQQFLRPFVAYVAKEKDGLLRSHVKEHIFEYLIRQSEFGQDCEAKFEAWKQAGFPGDSWRDMELVVDSDDEGSPEEDNCEDSDGDNAVSDPRAGSVHVELKQLQFEPSAVADMLLKQHAATFEVRNRKSLKVIADSFTKMSAGIYPLQFPNFGKSINVIRGIKKSAKLKNNLMKASKQLLAFENSLKLKKGKKRKHSSKQQTESNESKTEETAVSESASTKRKRHNVKKNRGPKSTNSKARKRKHAKKRKL